MSALAEYIINFLDSTFSWFRPFHVWIDGLLAEYPLHYIVVGILVFTAIYFYFRFKKP